MKTTIFVSTLTAVSLITSLNAGGIDMPAAHKKVAKAVAVEAPVAPAPVAEVAQSNWAFYVGGLVGGAFGDARFTSLTTDDATTPNPTESHQTRAQNPYAVAGLFVGVLYHFSDLFYTGLEVEGNFDSLKLRTSVNDTRLGAQNPDFSFTLSRKYQVLPSLMLGYKWTDTSSVYVKLGAGFTAYDVTEDAGVAVRNTVRTNAVHFVPAIGVATALADNVGARLELSGELLGKDIVSNSVAAGANPARQDTTVKANSFAMKFGVFWKM